MGVMTADTPVSYRMCGPRLTKTPGLGWRGCENLKTKEGSMSLLVDRGVRVLNGVTPHLGSSSLVPGEHLEGPV